MIIVRMLGGLGNQMFQHAAGAALAQHHQCDLRWDLSAYDNLKSERIFDLHRIFGIDIPRADESSMRFVLGWRGHAGVRAAFNRRHLTWARSKAHAIEPHFQYWPGFWLLPSNTYLDGYWQSDKYFETINDAIRKAFTFSLPLSDCNKYISEKINTRNSVSIHVRRGDYISNPATNRIHGCCSPEYYEQAIKNMLDQLIDPHFFIFSDDPEWARCNLALPASCTYINHNQGDDSYIDMQLMSMCQHHIIANSSFSWWGAWLNAKPHKRVIAPRQWFKNQLLDTHDIYCAQWITL